MEKFIVNQNLLCEVNVNYRIEAINENEAQKIVSGITSPTCFNGADYEIIYDGIILSTNIKGLNHENFN